MWRYGWNYDRTERGHDQGFGARDRDPGRVYDRGFRGYDHGYRDGWGMTGLNNTFLRGPRPEERGYDPPFRGRPRHRDYGRDFGRYGSWAPRGRPWGSMGWRGGGYDGGWY